MLLAMLLRSIIRGHWAIESSLDPVTDRVLRDNERRVRINHSGECSKVTACDDAILAGRIAVRFLHPVPPPVSAERVSRLGRIGYLIRLR